MIIAVKIDDMDGDSYIAKTEADCKNYTDLVG